MFKSLLATIRSCLLVLSHPHISRMWVNKLLCVHKRFIQQTLDDGESFFSVSRLRKNVIYLGSASQDGVRNGAVISLKPNVPSISRKNNCHIFISKWLGKSNSTIFVGRSVTCSLRKTMKSQTFLRPQLWCWALRVWQLWPLRYGWQRGRRKTPEAHYGCNRQWLPCAHRPNEEHSLMCHYFSKRQDLTAKGLLPVHAKVSWQLCQLHPPFSCWNCQVSLILHHGAFLPIYFYATFYLFPVFLYLASTQ